MADEKRHATYDQARQAVQQMIDKGLSKEEISAAMANVVVDGQDTDTDTKSKSWWDQHPNVRQVAEGVLNTLPAMGAVAGGVLGAPLAAMQTGTVVGIPTGLATEAGAVGLGAGAGRGARDLIAEATGIEQPTSPTSKGIRIGADTVGTAAMHASMPGVVEALKTPAQTLKQLEGVLPKWMRPDIGSIIEPAQGKPAPNYTRPSSPMTVTDEPIPTKGGPSSGGVRVAPQGPQQLPSGPDPRAIGPATSVQGPQTLVEPNALPPGPAAPKMIGPATSIQLGPGEGPGPTASLATARPAIRIAGKAATDLAEGKVPKGPTAPVTETRAQELTNKFGGTAPDDRPITMKPSNSKDAVGDIKWTARDFDALRQVDADHPDWDIEQKLKEVYRQRTARSAGYRSGELPKDE